MGSKKISESIKSVVKSDKKTVKKDIPKSLSSLKKDYIMKRFLIKSSKTDKSIAVYYVPFTKESPVLDKNTLKRMANSKVKTSLSNLEVIYAKSSTSGIGKNRKTSFNTIKIKPWDVDSAFITRVKNHREVRKYINSLCISSKELKEFEDIF